MAVFLIYFEAYPGEGEDENTGDDALVEEVVGIYLFVPYCHCQCVRHVDPSVSRHCSVQTEREDPRYTPASSNTQRYRERRHNWFIFDMKHSKHSNLSI